MPLAFLASLRPQRQLTRFTGEIWVIFFCEALGAPIPLLRAHAVARTQCACQKFVLDQYGDHVLTCKKHTGAIAGHDHVMNVSAQLARNSGLSVRINRKVATTAADSNKQGNVQAMEFGIPGYDDLVWDVSLVSDRIGSSTQHGPGRASMVSCNSVTTSTLGLASRTTDTNVNMLPRTSLSHLQSYLSLARFILNFYITCGCWLTCRRSSTSNEIEVLDRLGDEEDIGSKRFKWSRASTFSYNRNAIGLAVAYASAIRTHLSVHGTAHPMSAASVRPRSAAHCLICSAVGISHLRQQGNPPAGSSAVSGPVRSDILNGLGAGAVGGGGNPSLVSSMSPGVVPSSVDSASAPPSSGRGNYLPAQSQASYHSASSSPSARRPSSGFDGVNEEANVRANAAVVDEHADVRASVVMTDDNGDDADGGTLDDTLSEILGVSSRVATSFDHDLAFGAVDINDDLACTSLLSPLSALPPPIAFCCCWGAHLRSRSFHNHNYLFPLLVVVL